MSMDIDMGDASLTANVAAAEMSTPNLPSTATLSSTASSATALSMLPPPQPVPPPPTPHMTRSERNVAIMRLFWHNVLAQNFDEFRKLVHPDIEGTTTYFNFRGRETYLQLLPVMLSTATEWDPSTARPSAVNPDSEVWTRGRRIWYTSHQEVEVRHTATLTPEGQVIAVKMERITELM